MIQPDFKTFSKLARQGNLVPVYETYTADLLTPVGAHLRIAHDAKYSFLLESVEGGENIARYTFTGANPNEVFRARGRNLHARNRWPRNPSVSTMNPVEQLRRLTARYRPVRVPGLPPLIAGAIGYFAYDMVRLVEKIPATGRDDMGLDDCVMMFYLGLIAFDHVQHRVWIIRNVFTEGEGSLREKYDAAVREIAKRGGHSKDRLPKQRRATRNTRTAARSLEHDASRNILAARAKSEELHSRGRYFSNCGEPAIFGAKTNADPFEIYRALRVVNPSPYLYFLKLDDVSVVGSSPEMLVKVQGRDAFYRPIAGTVPRGRNEEEDRELEAKLLADPKERAEHVMLVDLGRNDLGRVCEYGSVKAGPADVRRALLARDAFGVEFAGAVARRRGLFRRADVVLSGGHAFGRAKVRAMEIIDELEPTRRGIYAARFCISIFPAISIRASGCARSSRKTGERTFRQAAESWRIRCLSANTRNRRIKLARW